MNNLICRISDLRVLLNAYGKVKLTYNIKNKKVNWNLLFFLNQSLRDGRYCFFEARKKYKDKPTEFELDYRIDISMLKNIIVQEAIFIVLMEVFKYKFLKIPYGLRSAKSIPLTFLKIKNKFKLITWCFTVTLQNYFTKSVGFRILKILKTEILCIKTFLLITKFLFYSMHYKSKQNNLNFLLWEIYFYEFDKFF